MSPPKIIHLTIAVENPTTMIKHFKHKDYLPQKSSLKTWWKRKISKCRFDEAKQLAFLFKEEDLAPGEKKKYSIGIIDIWNIPQKDIDYLRTRAKTAFGFLQDTRFEEKRQAFDGQYHG